MLLAESLSFWGAVLAYAISFMLFAISAVFKKNRLAPLAVKICISAFTLHTATLTLRWLLTGHPPFVSFFESISAAMWFGVLGYLWLQSSTSGLQISGVVVCGVAFLLLGWANTPSHAGEALSVGLFSIWLYVHATFATASVGCFLVAAGISVVWLWKRYRNGALTEMFSIPTPDIIDERAFRYIAVGFLFYTVMLLSGAVWANEAWGRYWGWDPIEIWSLITWLVYVLYLHLRFTFKKLRGVFTAWYAILAVLFAGFSLWGVGYIYKTIHTYG